MHLQYTWRVLSALCSHSLHVECTALGVYLQCIGSVRTSSTLHSPSQHIIAHWPHVKCSALEVYLQCISSACTSTALHSPIQHIIAHWPHVEYTANVLHLHWKCTSLHFRYTAFRFTPPYLHLKVFYLGSIMVKTILGFTKCAFVDIFTTW